MAVLLFVCTLVIGVSAAPAINNNDSWQEILESWDSNKLHEVNRAKRSGYGNMYMTPCAAAAASAPGYSSAGTNTPISAYATAAQGPSYSYGHTYHPAHPHKGHTINQGPYFNYGHPYYRSEEEQENDDEVMSFSDMHPVAFEQMPMARYAYEPAPTSQLGGNSGGAIPSSSGQAVGVFPSANIGRYSLPILVSCSPSIAHGRLVKTQPHYGGSASSYQGNMYRFVDNHPQHEEMELHQGISESTHNTQQKGESHQ